MGCAIGDQRRNARAARRPSLARTAAVSLCHAQRRRGSQASSQPNIRIGLEPCPFTAAPQGGCIRSGNPSAGPLLATVAPLRQLPRSALAPKRSPPPRCQPRYAANPLGVDEPPVVCASSQGKPASPFNSGGASRLFPDQHLLDSGQSSSEQVLVEAQLGTSMLRPSCRHSLHTAWHSETVTS